MLVGVPYPNITDVVITHYLYTKSFVDTMDGLHLGFQDTSEIHSQRIESLINLVRIGIFLKPITITYDDESKEVKIRIARVHFNF